MKKVVLVLAGCFFLASSARAQTADYEKNVCRVYSDNDLVVKNKRKYSIIYQVYKASDGKLYGTDYLYGKTLPYGSSFGAYVVLKQNGGILTLKQKNPGVWVLTLIYDSWFGATSFPFKVSGSFCDEILTPSKVASFYDFVSRKRHFLR
jgi:hypothetical protein